MELNPAPLQKKSSKKLFDSEQNPASKCLLTFIKISIYSIEKTALVYYWSVITGAPVPVIRKYFLLAPLFTWEVGCAHHSCSVFDGLLWNQEQNFVFISTIPALTETAPQDLPWSLPYKFFQGLTFSSLLSPNCPTTTLAKFASPLLFSDNNDEEFILSFQMQSQINPPELWGDSFHPSTQLFQ